MRAGRRNFVVAFKLLSVFSRHRFGAVVGPVLVDVVLNHCGFHYFIQNYIIVVEFDLKVVIDVVLVVRAVKRCQIIVVSRALFEKLVER